MAFRFDKLTIKAQEAVARAQELAAEAGNPQIEPLHLLAALLGRRRRHRAAGARKDRRERRRSSSGSSRPSWGICPRRAAARRRRLSQQLAKVLEAAQAEADGMKDEFVSTEHLLLALARHEVEGQGRSASSTRSPRTRCSARCRPCAAVGPRHRSNARGQVPGPGKIRHRSGRAGAGRASSIR